MSVTYYKKRPFRPLFSKRLTAGGHVYSYVGIHVPADKYDIQFLSYYQTSSRPLVERFRLAFPELVLVCRFVSGGVPGARRLRWQYAVCAVPVSQYVAGRQGVPTLSACRLQ